MNKSTLPLRNGYQYLISESSYDYYTYSVIKKMEKKWVDLVPPLPTIYSNLFYLERINSSSEVCDNKIGITKLEEVQ